jgi:hypothetical protein
MDTSDAAGCEKHLSANLLIKSTGDTCFEVSVWSIQPFVRAESSSVPVGLVVPISCGLWCFLWCWN